MKWSLILESSCVLADRITVHYTGHSHPNLLPLLHLAVFFSLCPISSLHAFFCKCIIALFVMKTVNANSGKLKACWWAHNNYCIFSVWNAFLFKPNWETRPKQKHFIPSEYATENGPSWKWAPLFCDSIVDKALLFGLLWLDSLSGDMQNRLLSLFYMHRQLLYKPSFLLCWAALVGGRFIIALRCSL